MKITMRAIALVSATALVGAGISAPTAPIATAQTTAGKAPVGGLTWPDAETGFGGEVRIVPQGTPEGDYQFSVQPEYAGFKFSVDSAGVVTVKAPVNKENNSQKRIEFPVTVKTRAGRHVGFYQATVTAQQKLNEHKAVWESVTMRGNETATARQTASLPAGTSFKIRHDLNPQLRNTVEATINHKGDVTVKPKGNLLPGRFTVAVEVWFPNGNTQLETLYFTISEQGQWQRDNATITYPTVTIPANKAGSAAPTKKNVPAGTTFALGEVPSGWTASVDRSTGVVTAKAPANSGRGARVKFSVMATFPDNSKKASQIRFTVGESSRTTPNQTGPTLGNGSSGAGILLGALALLGAAGAAIFAFMRNNGGFRLPF